MALFVSTALTRVYYPIFETIRPISVIPHTQSMHNLENFLLRHRLQANATANRKNSNAN